MKLIKPSAEIWEPCKPWESHRDEKTGEVCYSLACEQLGEKPSREALLNVVYKQIERAGRVCYKSEDKITDTSAKPFMDRLIESKHYAMLEHGTVYLLIPYNALHRLMHPYLVNKYELNPYSKCTLHGIVNHAMTDLFGEPEIMYYMAITTNMRVIVENGWKDDLQYISMPTSAHARRVTVHFTCSRQVSHEFVRHRKMSFAQESTRYCNYTKGKYGSELTFIDPCWETRGEDVYSPGHEDMTFSFLLNNTEAAYNHLVKDLGWKPQQAATILPNALKTELVVTGFTEDWKHFFDLRALGTTGAPHPQAKELALPLYAEFRNRKYID